MAMPFFKDVDWDALQRGAVAPPYVPPAVHVDVAAMLRGAQDGSRREGRQGESQGEGEGQGRQALRFGHATFRDAEASAEEDTDETQATDESSEEEAGTSDEAADPDGLLAEYAHAWE